MSRIDVEVLSSFVQVGDSPSPENVNAAIKRFWTLRERPVGTGFYLFKQICKYHETRSYHRGPLAIEFKDINPINNYTWDYVYEPRIYELIDGLVLRYVETITHQALVENIASEQSARMVAMKAATDNAGNVIEELKLVYNKTRQAAITKELSEIVAVQLPFNNIIYRGQYGRRKNCTMYRSGC